MTMTCAECREKIEAYVDSELPAGQVAELEPHLRACPSCAADALGRMQMKRMTQAAGTRYAPTPEFREHLEKRLNRAQAKSKPWRLGWWPKLAIFAALAVVLLAGAGLWQRRAAEKGALTALADLHVSALASPSPVDVVSTDRHTVKPWFAGKLPFTFNLPELQNTPFKLVGGRVVYVENGPGAQLLFEGGKHQLSLFIAQDRRIWPFGGEPTATHTMVFNVEAWSQGGLRYTIISDAGAADVHQLGELLRQAGRG